MGDVLGGVGGKPALDLGSALSPGHMRKEVGDTPQP